jgi:predicted nucleic acid-binding protein
MRRAVYDTRFLVELYYSQDEKLLRRLREEKKRQEKYISTITIHKVYKFSLAREGWEDAILKTTLLKKDFQIVPVDNSIAQFSAELRHKYNLSMGDSMIAATAHVLKAVCISDDPHFQQIKEIKTTWV